LHCQHVRFLLLLLQTHKYCSNRSSFSREGTVFLRPGITSCLDLLQQPSVPHLDLRRLPLILLLSEVGTKAWGCRPLFLTALSMTSSLLPLSFFPLVSLRWLIMSPHAGPPYFVLPVLLAPRRLCRGSTLSLHRTSGKGSPATLSYSFLFFWRARPPFLPHPSSFQEAFLKGSVSRRPSHRVARLVLGILSLDVTSRVIRICRQLPT